MPSPIYALIEGRDLAPRRIDDPVAAGLTDWFGKYLVDNANSDYPVTFRSLLTNTIPNKTWVPFAVGDGTYLNYKEENAHIPRDLRFIVVATPTSPSTTNPRGWPADAIVADVNHTQSEAFKKAMPTLFIVGSTAFDSETAFLQIASWEPTSGSLNFYQRDVKFSKEASEYPSWLYLGSSGDAFEPDTRGKGPFDGHVNGTLVMKELAVPWVHWQSMKFTISQTFPPDAPIRSEPLLNPSDNLNSFDFLAGAERLELIVKKAATKW
ncbi:hypothetical protein L873DRAFT_316210 [Choiromyces venosus 120613-1]|uniref:Uncharacterized protein n=1 Tax=Choiromyces venosus 120613-1 TaxID=1336337 RepID=A0A3N4IZW5_9PEZI|nr:hypothetical protein L873DRAFT_316210 [Choiromyces venosus 120613-1]